MKIYQVVEFGGEYEDRYEWVLKTYLSKEKALEYKELMQKKFEEDEELMNKCLYECRVEWWDGNVDSQLIQEIKNNCVNADLSIKSEGDEKWLSCSNNCSGYKDVYGYRMVEYEVEDAE